MQMSQRYIINYKLHESDPWDTFYDSKDYSGLLGSCIKLSDSVILEKRYENDIQNVSLPDEIYSMIAIFKKFTSIFPNYIKKKKIENYM